MDDAAYCDCWRLLRALEDEELPDHVCWDIAAENVGRWLSETLAGRETEYADAFYDPLTMDAADVTDEVLEAAQWIPIQPNWPVPMDGRYLWLVLRQWVQEPPSPTLATQLAQEPSWLAWVEQYREVYDRWRAHPDASADEENSIWINEPERVWRALGWDCGEPPERVMAQRLRQDGLPDTPMTMRHLRAVVAGRAEPLPARGVLVTTKVLLRGREAERYGLAGLEYDSPTPHLSFSASDLVTGPLLRLVNAVMLRHRDWCRDQLGRNPLTEPSAIRAAQPWAFVLSGERQPISPMDYYVEAVKGLPSLLDTLAASPRADENREGAITKYLDKVYRRVYNRHQRACTRALKLGRDAVVSLLEQQGDWRGRLGTSLNDDTLEALLEAFLEPPEGWRDQIRAILTNGGLRELLAASGGTLPAALRSRLEQQTHS